jgi:hypothetical protein
LARVKKFVWLVLHIYHEAVEIQKNHICINKHWR